MAKGDQHEPKLSLSVAKHDLLIIILKGFSNWSNPNTAQTVIEANIKTYQNRSSVLFHAQRGLAAPRSPKPKLSQAISSDPGLHSDRRRSSDAPSCACRGRGGRAGGSQKCVGSMAPASWVQLLMHSLKSFTAYYVEVAGWSSANNRCGMSVLQNKDPGW